MSEIAIIYIWMDQTLVISTAASELVYLHTPFGARRVHTIKSRRGRDLGGTKMLENEQKIRKKGNKVPRSEVQNLFKKERYKTSTKKM